MVLVEMGLRSSSVCHGPHGPTLHAHETMRNQVLVVSTIWPGFCLLRHTQSLPPLGPRPDSFCGMCVSSLFAFHKPIRRHMTHPTHLKLQDATSRQFFLRRSLKNSTPPQQARHVSLCSPGFGRCSSSKVCISKRSAAASAGGGSGCGEEEPHRRFWADSHGNHDDSM